MVQGQASRPLTVAIETHGCKLNQADSGVLGRQFADAGFRVVSTGDPVDVYVVNTCTVTHVADRKARHALRSARRRNPDATIVATGCYAQRAPQQLEAVEAVDIVAGNTDKSTLVQSIVAWKGEPLVPCAVGDDGQAASPATLRTRAMVKIQEGCDQVCAYCIVPKVRGRERSVPPDGIIDEIERYGSLGYKEVVLTGTQLGSYGFDLPGMTLSRLLRHVLAETGVPRLRVSSLQPQEVGRDLLELWKDTRLCPSLSHPAAERQRPRSAANAPALHRPGLRERRGQDTQTCARRLHHHGRDRRLSGRDAGGLSRNVRAVREGGVRRHARVSLLGQTGYERRPLRGPGRCSGAVG